MKNEISNSMNIKEKADFVYLNSGIILSKLENEFDRADTENSLQILLFFDTKLDELTEIAFNLINKSCPVKHKNNYESAIAIIFHMAYLINSYQFNEDGKERLRNQLRLYTKYFNCDKDDLTKNKQYIRLYEKKPD